MGLIAAKTPVYNGERRTQPSGGGTVMTRRSSMADGRTRCGVIVACLALALVGSGCRSQGRRDDPGYYGDRINLGVRLLDISTFHMDAYSDWVADIDRRMMSEDSREQLAGLFRDVSADPMYADGDVDLTIRVTTKRKGTMGEAVAELQANKAYTSEVLLTLKAMGSYAGLVKESNGDIRNKAAIGAIETAISELRDDQRLVAYARELRGEPEPELDVYVESEGEGEEELVEEAAPAPEGEEEVSVEQQAGQAETD